jgi:agmatine deiminase
MKQMFLALLLLSLGILTGVQKIDNLEKDPFPLTHWLSEAEAARWDEVGRDFYETDPPAGPVHNVAEFEKMEGVLIRYPFGIPLSLIAAMSQHTKVVTIVSSTSQQNTVLNQYNSSGVNTDNCDFLIAASDSYWTRDYGPWYIIDGEGSFAIANFPYNRPRPNDNDIPIEMAEFLEIDLYGMNVIHTGGNYMTDGYGIAASTTLVYDENTIPDSEVDQRMLDYLGIHTYFVVDDPNNTYIDHIDCWGKFLDVDKILIREVPASHPQYNAIEQTASYFASQTSSYGNNFQVFRVYTPNNQPYTNSLILNEYVYLPVTGSQYDNQAIESYQAAMPGYTIVGVTAGGAGWESTDALHCRTKGIADRQMLYIHHLPLLEEQPADIVRSVSANITAYSGEELIENEIFLYYKVGGSDYNQVLMSNTEDNIYEADIPAQPAGSQVSYYIEAIDAAANIATHPFIGEPDPHVYYAGGDLQPQLSINPSEFELVMRPWEIETRNLQITNSGGGVINYSLQFLALNRDVSGSYVSCDSEFFSPGETISLNFTVHNESPDNEWLNEVNIEFPTGFDVINATDFVGGSGGAMVYDGSQGNGATINWFGETVSGWGVLQGGQSATSTVEILVAPDFSGNAQLNWIIAGDGYGAAPHSTSGDITLEIYAGPVNWITASQYGGDLWAQETDDLEIIFEPANLIDGDYYCNIVVSWEEGEEIIPVQLTVLSMPVLDDQITQPVSSLIAFPNPFNPQTNISFTLAEISHVKLKVYNVKGQLVDSLIDNEMAAGVYDIVWQADHLVSGVYLLHFDTPLKQVQKKLILLK